jgi:hypothetical protein
MRSTPTLNPSLRLTVLVLAGGPHPRRGTALFTPAAMTTTFVGGLALAFCLGELWPRCWGSASRRLNW